MKEPGEQEKIVEYLHYCETITALSVLKVGKLYLKFLFHFVLKFVQFISGGTFVVKIFTMFEDSTINLLYLLNRMFENVTVFKPCTSKSGNSEVYVVSVGYRGIDLIANSWDRIISAYKNGSSFLSKSMFHLSEIPQQFFEEIKMCANFFMKHQTKTILDNIYFFENNAHDNIQSKKWLVTKMFFQLHPINIIPEEKKLVPNVPVGKNWRIHSENIDRNIHSYGREHFFKTNNFDNLLDIKLGKRIETVYNSIFAPNEHLLIFQSNFYQYKSNLLLYQQIEISLGTENIFIDCKECNSNIYYEFQHNIFFKIYNSISSKNLIIFNVPLVSNFLVGLLYILICGFRKIIFWKGFIILYECDVIALEKIRHILHKVSLIYEEIIQPQIEKKSDFEKDIIQLVSPSKFDERFNNLIDLIWNHNCHIFSERNMLLSILKGNNTELISE